MRHQGGRFSYYSFLPLPWSTRPNGATTTMTMPAALPPSHAPLDVVGTCVGLAPPFFSLFIAFIDLPSPFPSPHTHTPALAAPLLAGKGDGAHKPFWPMDQQDVMTIALATLGLIVAAGGGIGGGGILVRQGEEGGEDGQEGCTRGPYTNLFFLSTQVPLYILVLGFSPRRAIPLSNVTILVGRTGREGGNGRRAGRTLENTYSCRIFHPFLPPRSSSFTCNTHTSNTGGFHRQRHLRLHQPTPLRRPPPPRLQPHPHDGTHHHRR